VSELRWLGRVEDVEGDAFTVELTPDGHEGPVLVAKYRRELLPDVVVGNVLDVTRDGVTRRDLGCWTAEEIDRAVAEGRRLAALLNGLAE